MPRRPAPPDLPKLGPQQANDAPWQLQAELEPPLQPGIYRRLLKGGFEEVTASPANDYYRQVMGEQQQSLLTGPLHPVPQSLGGPAEASQTVEGAALKMGADLVGTCRVMAEHVYPNRADTVYPYGIVLAQAMDYENLAAAPHQPAGEEVTRGYMNLGWVCINLARWLRDRGWPARAHHPRGDRYGECDLLFIPHAVAAGLGELGKHGSLLTPELGPRLRLGMVTTTLPLAQPEAIDYGFDNFCVHCTRCTDTCPGQAISSTKARRRGSERWLIDTEACLPYFAAYDGCGVCLKECVLTRPSRAATRKLARSISNRYGTSQWWQVTHPDHDRLMEQELKLAKG